MIKVCFLVEPLRGKAIIWKQTDDIDHPWIVVGKVKISKASDWIIISLAKIEEVLRQNKNEEEAKNEKQEREKQESLF